MSDPRIFFSAGETSGDLHAAALAAAIRRRHPSAEFRGLGGPRLAAEGTGLVADLDRLAIVGFVEVLRHLPYFLRLRRRVVDEWARWRPDVVVCIDYPGFNLRLAKAAHARGIPVLYYVAPQVWAWHRSRARTLAEWTDAVAVVFPFEEAVLRSAGARAHFVGHPLVERAASWPDRQTACRGLGLDPERPVLGLFPGSRRGEVRRLLTPFAAAARRLVQENGRLQVRVARASGLAEDLYRREAGLATVEDAVALLCASTAALVKSGTTTVEAALAGTPMVIAYRVNPLTYAIARRVVRVPHIGMVNLLAGRAVVPEFIQGAVRPRALARALGPLLDVDSEARRRMRGELETVRRGLGDAGASERTADLVDEILARRDTAGEVRA